MSVANPAVSSRRPRLWACAVVFPKLKTSTKWTGVANTSYPLSRLFQFMTLWRKRKSKNEGDPKMDIKPLRDRVVVRPVVRRLSDILYVPNSEKFNEGTVVAVGPKVRDAQVGDFVKYGNGTYLDWPVHEVDGQDYQIIQEADIAMIVEAENG
jgi:co-chaperonin GroES (HSP10)